MLVVGDEVQRLPPISYDNLLKQLRKIQLFRSVEKLLQTTNVERCEAFVGAKQPKEQGQEQKNKTYHGSWERTGPIVVVAMGLHSFFQWQQPCLACSSNASPSAATLDHSCSMLSKAAAGKKAASECHRETPGNLRKVEREEWNCRVWPPARTKSRFR